MNNSKLIRLCKTLNRKEFSRFYDLVRSPYLNQHQKVLELVRYLLEIHPAFKRDKLDEQKIFEQLWPDETFKKAKLHHVLSYTIRSLELFLKLESVLEDDFAFDKNILSVYRTKKLNKRYEASIKKLNDKMTDFPYRNSDYHFNMLSLKTEADKFYLNQQKYLRDESLQDRSDHLDLYFLAEKLRSSCEMINRELFFNMNYEHRFLNEVIAHIEKNFEYYQSFSSISFYYRVYLSLTKPEEPEHYFALRKMIAEQGGHFPADERKDLYYYAYNFCLRKVNKGDPSFLKEAFELMKQLLKEGHLYENGRLSEWHYKNMSTLGLRSGEAEWTRTFIETHKEQLPEAVAENAYSYNLALYFFNTQQYDRALVLLNTVVYTDIVYNLDAKALLLRIYYELNETETLSAHSEAFKKYISRNKTIAKHKYTRYLKFFKHGNSLYKIKSEMNFQSKAKTKKELLAFKQQLDSDANIPNKIWLTSKYEELLVE